MTQRCQITSEREPLKARAGWGLRSPVRKSQRSLAHWPLLSFLCLSDYSLGLSTSHFAATSQETRARATQSSPGHSTAHASLGTTSDISPLPNTRGAPACQGIVSASHTHRGDMGLCRASVCSRPSANLPSSTLPRPHLCLSPRLLHNPLQFLTSKRPRPWGTIL